MRLCRPLLFVETPQDRRLPLHRFASQCLHPSRAASAAASSRTPAPGDAGLFWSGRRLLHLWSVGWLLCVLGGVLPGPTLRAQAVSGTAALGDASAAQARTQRFLAGRSLPPGTAQASQTSAAEALQGARSQHLAMLGPINHQGTGAQQKIGWRPAISIADLAAAWQPLGPVAVNSIAYGAITGRITSIALDPNDLGGNTVWLGTTGGGVWKSTNAAGPQGSVSFAPMTDTIAAFAANAGATTVPSLSIGAVAVQPAPTAVVLAGTGDPNDATDSYYGEGILRSADGGQTWTLAIGSRDGANGNHSFAGLGTAGLAWSTASPSLVVAAMTRSLEGVVVGAAGPFSVPGLYYSTDAGVTWQMATVYDGAQIVQVPRSSGLAQPGNNATAVVWDARRSLFIAALGAHGYYSSPDGQTWTRLANQPGAGLTVANCPVGVNGVGSPNCPILRGALAVQPVSGDLYALTVDASDIDQGLWQDFCNAGGSGQCASPAPLFATRLDHGALEVGPGSAAGAASGSTVISQGSYDLTLSAAPSGNSGTMLYVGTMDLYGCSISTGSSACTLRNTTNAGDGCNAPAGVAPAQHALAVLAQASGQPLLFLGNDGGLWRSTDGVAETGPVCSASDASHFENLNNAIARGGSLAEVVGFAQDPSRPDTLLAGLGAAGSAATTSASALTGWPQLSAGEGGLPQLDPATPNDWFLAVGAGVNLKLCEVGGACTAADFLSPATVGEAQVSYDSALIDPPTLLDPQDTANLLTATCRVWRGPAASGVGWGPGNALSAPLDGSAAPCGNTSALIRSLAAGGPPFSAPSAQNSGSGVLYAGMAGAIDGGGSLGGHIFLTRQANTANATTAWTDITNGIFTNGKPFNAGGNDISAVIIDPHDATGATVYATVMGFGFTGTIPHVYRSTDFGAHWTDVSFGLPNAPANGLVVDPNDANTVYVAMDTGVYVTQAILTCSTTPCWNPLGTGLPNAPVTAIAAGAGLPTGDGRLGMLRAATYGRGLWQTPLLTALGVQQPGLAANPSSLSFGATAVASENSAQVVTLTSNGDAPVTISSLAMAGDFVETDACTGQTLAVGASCSISVQFAPTATGARTGMLTIYANIPGGQVQVALSGTGTPEAPVVLTPLSLRFPATLVNQATAAQIVTVSNTSGSVVTVGTAAVSGDFAISANTCGATLAAQAGCSIALVFKPTASGSRTGVLTVNDSVGTQSAQLSGVGQAPATDTLAPLSLSFGPQSIGAGGPAQQITLTNAGDVALTLISAAVTSGDFVATNACASSLAPHSTCAINVSFVPAATGTRTGTLAITDNVRTETIPLTGIGLAPPGVSLTPVNVNFSAIGVGLNSPTQTLTLTNNGGVPLAIASTAVTGDFVVVSNSCSATLDVGQACTVLLFFAPSVPGVQNGTLVLTDNAPSKAQTVTLSGMGVDFGLTPNGATTVTVASGGTATFPLALSSLAGLTGNVAFACTGAPANSICTVSPATIALGGKVLLSAVVQTGMRTAKLRPWRPWASGHDGILLAIAPLAWLGLRRKRGRGGQPTQGGSLPRLLILLLLVTAGGLAGCGATRVIPLSGTGGGGGGGSSLPTSSGTYHLTVSGSTAGVTHSVSLTLIVQ